MPYLLFAGDTYYPSGGARDFIGAYASIAQVYEAFLSNDTARRRDWWHIAVLNADGTMRIVKAGGDQRNTEDADDR
jgi:hypothetical protein